MNALIQRSNEARAAIQAATSMDDLSYQLMILESGCQCLDDLVRPVDDTTKEDCVRYRDHLASIGWWTWYELVWRAFEVRLWAEWSGPESLVALQPARWKRKRLLDEAYTLRHTRQYNASFDNWMTLVKEKKIKALPPLEVLNKQTQKHHANH